MNELSSKQLRQAARIKDQITSLQRQLNRLFTGITAGKGSPAKPATRKRRKMSAAARAKISAAATARWAKIKAGKK